MSQGLEGMERVSIGVIGIGMVGTPLARYFQEVRGYSRGSDLFLYDTDPAKGFFDDVNRAEIVFISVPTPRAPDGSANLSAVESAFQMLNGGPPAPGADQPLASLDASRSGRPEQARGGKIVVLKSTVPPGTTEAFQRRYPRHRVLFNPENLTERFAWEDFLRPDTQIVGFTEQSMDAAHLVLALLPKAPFMSPWGLHTYRRVAITATEAEIIKYARNVHFARKINLANLLAKLAETMGVSYDHVRAGMAADHRIGDSHLDVAQGGYRGFGGFCLPKDLDAFIAALERAGLAECARLLGQDREFNAALIAAQGLTIGEVSVHDHDLREKLRRRNAVPSPELHREPEAARGKGNEK